MIEDIDICVRFQDSVDEPGLGHKDGETDEKGKGDGNIADWGETLHFQIFSDFPIYFFFQTRRRGERVSILPSGEQQVHCIIWSGVAAL